MKRAEVRVTIYGDLASHGVFTTLLIPPFRRWLFDKLFYLYIEDKRGEWIGGIDMGFDDE